MGHTQSQSRGGALLRSDQVVAEWRGRARQIAAVVALLWLCTLHCVSSADGEGIGLRPSRRLMNAPYTLWLLAQCGTWLLGFLLLELVGPPVPPELEARGCDLVLAISRNLLPFFLAANLGTGAVNLSIRTLDVCDGSAVAILVIYLALLCAGAAVASIHKTKTVL